VTWLLADIHRPMNTGTWLFPLDLSRVISTRWLSPPSRNAMCRDVLRRFPDPECQLGPD
jgi:hypothetical protein